jgi:hypothetical protein
MKRICLAVLVAGLGFLSATARGGDAPASGSFDPNAGRLLDQLLSHYEFTPGIVSGNGAGDGRDGLFELSRPPREEEAAILDRTIELFGHLKRSEFTFIKPREQSDDLDEMRQYASLRPYCQTYPVRYWDTRAQRVFDTDTRSIAEIVGLPRGVAVPYAPNLPRPIDYELLYPAGRPLAAATEGYALYQLESGSDDQTLYVFRSDDFAYPSERVGRKSIVLSSWGRFVAFTHPDCKFKGSVAFRSDCKAKGGGGLRRHYLSEIIKIESDYFALTAWQMYCKVEGSRYMDMPTKYYLLLWDLGRGDNMGGRIYYMRQIPEGGIAAP